MALVYPAHNHPMQHQHQHPGMSGTNQNQGLSLSAGALSGPGNLIKGKWKICRKIGQGAFGEIYSARNVVTGALVAIKVERVDSKKQVLKLEVAVLKKLQACPYVVSFVTCGRHNDYNYMVMELLGENISELRRRQPQGRFSMQSTLKLGMQMLRAIEAVHDMGYLHRDIKPSNFAMGLANKRHHCYLIDFGLARRYILPTGEVRPSRDQTGFRGTARYASINSHQSKDLSRRDDLWSLLYVLIEFGKGQLPWRRIKDKDQVGEMKTKCNTPDLVSELPTEFLVFMNHLQTLKYADRPDYRRIYNILHELYTRIGGDDSTPFDWERVPCRNAQRPRPLPSLFDLCFLKMATNLHSYKVEELSSSTKKKMLEFIIRIQQGKWPKKIMAKLMDETLEEIDLSTVELNDEDYKHIIKSCVNLKTISLPQSTDIMIKELVSINHNLEHLTLSASKNLTNKALKTVSENCPRLQTLKLKCSERITDKAVEYVLRACTQLTELSLFGCKKFKGTAFKPFASTSSRLTGGGKKKHLRLQRLNLSYCELSKRGFKQLCKISTDLKALNFSPLSTSFKITSSDFLGLIHNCRDLVTLDLSNYYFEMDTILIEVSRCCSALQTLLLDGIGMTDYGLQNVVQNCTRLETLRFRYGDGVTDASLHQIAKCCTGLKSLTLDFWNKFNRLSVSDHAIKGLLQSCTNLNELSLCNCLILTGACFPETGYFPFLRTLNLSECIQLNDFAIRRITESCPNLKKLLLNNLNNLTSTSLEAIAIGCPLLEELSLMSCSSFRDETMKNLLRVMPKLFMQVTRYTDGDLRGVSKEVHSATVDEYFARYPNTYREKAFERTRKRMFGMEG
eukprot:TRINITY_DN5186_c1_g2_i1.p1 TRINITY_DN5186_c1_g2~~TRINITY_DN5186_c1_g2_i1.p1  ORF type:complete len:848 (-),score=214.51 TRINITY_DN5186_c1_g2_i1:44-2587(-)